MKRFVVWTIAAALVLLTLNAAYALDIRYTNWGGGLSPNTWGYGTTALTMSGDAYRLNYYQDQTKMYGNLVGVGTNTNSYSFGASRPIHTTQYTYSNPSMNYRTYDYGAWNLNYAQARGSNWGFQTQGNYGNYWGTGYVGGYVAPVTGTHLGPTSGYYGYGHTSYPGTYNLQPYNYRTQYYRTPSATVSYGGYYY